MIMQYHKIPAVQGFLGDGQVRWQHCLATLFMAAFVTVISDLNLICRIGLHIFTIFYKRNFALRNPVENWKVSMHLAIGFPR